MTMRIFWLLLVALPLAGAIGCGGLPQMTDATITSEPWGEVDGQSVDRYTLDNGGMTVRIVNYGATVTELWMDGKDGERQDIVLGFDDVDGYIDRSPYFGCTVGRCANRIANASFTLDGIDYSLAANNGPHHLHGGNQGFDKVVWDSRPLPASGGVSVEFTRRSVDGEEGYPGNVDLKVVYTLTYDDELEVKMTATCDRATPVNLAHHSYWNLAGHDSGTVLDQHLALDCSRYTPGDQTLIPTGEIAWVEGTPLDFTRPKAIGRDIGQLPGDGGDDPGGFDHNFVIDGEVGSMRRAARVFDPDSGRAMEIWSDQAGIQFYSGNFLNGIAGKGGVSYDKHDGFCLETQVFPDAIHKEGREGWPSVVLRPGETYRHTMVHRFSVIEE